MPDYIPAGQRKGLLATFNGGFKLSSAGGGFYLNGIYHGSLIKGTASIVYYKTGTIKIGQWGRDFTMNSSIAGVRQNLKLLVDRGKVSVNANSDVMSNWGATLGGGYYVWRSGLGITKDGRVVYVYGSALNAEDLGKLLLRAGAVEGMQMDINPAWMKFDYYQAGSHPSDPTPVPLLPTQQARPLFLLQRVHPRLHRGLRAVTVDKTVVSDRDTGPQAALAVATVAPVSPVRWLRAAIMTTRPRQWPKNLLVFAAPLAGASLGRNGGLGYALIAMLAFGCASAAVYFVNDVADAERDRRHPVKRNRPIASGALPAGHALALALLAALCAVGAGVVIREPLLVASASAYLCLSFLYSFRLKHVPYVEMLIVASGFLLRVLGGAAATHVRPSVWFLMVCSLGALGVAVAKRYTELTSLGRGRGPAPPGDALVPARPAARHPGGHRRGHARHLPDVGTRREPGRAPVAPRIRRAAGRRARPVRPARRAPDRTPGGRPDYRDAVMLCCEAAWLVLFCFGLYVG